MEIGDILDKKYQIVGILGKGGMGTVYLGRNIKLETLWAIKEISKKNNSKLSALVEPNILKKLNHPNLPRIFDIFEDQENIYIIADYIEGISLDRELLKGVIFNEKQVVEWAIQICGVLSYLHDFTPNPIIYRDMKPSNIILARNGGVKLIDFGIAREYKTGSNSDTIYIGTIGYAAPEQYGTGQTSPASDIYSLGVTLFHLLTGKIPGRVPFGSECLKLGEDFFSRELRDIVAKCTNLNPSLRYQTTEELLNDLNIFNEKLIPDNSFVKNHRKKSKPVYRNFKKLVLNILDNSEFACEFACTAAKMSRFKVLLINLDIGSVRTKFYLGLDKAFSTEAYNDYSKYENLKNILNNGMINFDSFNSLCVKLNDCGDLYVLEGIPGVESLEDYAGIDFCKLIDEAYKNFDLTILISGKEYSSPLVKLACDKSDYSIIAARASMDILLEYKNSIEKMKDTFCIPLEKVRFIAWEYKEEFSLPESLLKQALGKDLYTGRVSYCENREKSRNMDGGLYARTAWRRHKEEYRKVLASFDIVPETTVGDYVRCKLGGLFGKEGWRQTLDE